MAIRRTSSGFTLIELSIVMVIIGLLVGGVVAGQSLIRSAQIRSLIGEHKQYQTVTNAFKDKYFALPGDMKNATRFWGVAAAGMACMTFPSTDTKTCNGDGNGKIEAISSTFESIEMNRYWQHLANAGLITGHYNGHTSLPLSKLGGNTNWAVMWQGILNTGMISFYGNYGHMITLSSATTSYLLPQEVWDIDTKLDDGKPATGEIVANTVSACTNTTDPTDLAAEYLSTSSNKNCRPVFRNQF